MRKTSFGLLLMSLVVAGCQNPAPAPASSTTETTTTSTSVAESTPAPDPNAKLKISDTKVGTGAMAANGDLLVVLYKGTLKNGTVFDSNTAPDKAPFSFVLGDGKVIPGWDQGLVGMKVGGNRKLEIPSKLAYGDQATGSIPANSDLNFDVQLLYIVKKGDEGVYDSKDIKVGTGAAAKAGDTVSVHYVGTLLNKKKFDSSRDRGTPFEFKLGTGSVIKGWDDGVVGMKVGGIRRLVIPPAIAYGDAGSGPIPPNSVLEFEIELLGINK